MKILYAITIFICLSLHYALSQPVSLRPDITVNFVKIVPNDISGIALDPVTNNLHMINFEVINLGMANVYDTLIYTTSDHLYYFRSWNRVAARNFISRQRHVSYRQYTYNKNGRKDCSR